MNRRKFLTMAGVPSVMVGGCMNNTSHRATFGEITLTNFRESEVDATVQVEKDEESVYDETKQLKGSAEGAAGQVEITEDWLEEDSHYDISVSMADNNSSNRITSSDLNDFISDNENGDCFPLSVNLEDNGINFLIGSSGSCS